LYTKAVHVRDTWGKKCNKTLFFSSKHDKVLPAIGLPVEEGRDNLFMKTQLALKYLLKNHKDEADWFVKADDDTFIIVENLRFLLNEFSSDDGLYLGHRFKSEYVKQGYMSGGAGYVLSNKALHQFVKGIEQSKCEISSFPEDILVGACLERMNVRAVDTRDVEMKQRFFPFQPKYHLIDGLLNGNSWFWDHSYYAPETGEDCCSTYTISFHYITPEMMHVLYYFIYDFKLVSP